MIKNVKYKFKFVKQKERKKEIKFNKEVENGDKKSNERVQKNLITLLLIFILPLIYVLTLMSCRYLSIFIPVKFLIKIPITGFVFFKTFFYKIFSVGFVATDQCLYW